MVVAATGQAYFAENGEIRRAMSIRRPLPETAEATQVIDEPTAPLPPVAEPPPPGAPVEEPPPDRDLWPWLVVLLVLVIAALVGAWLASRHNGGSPHVASAPAPTVAAAPRTKAPAKIVVPRLVGLRTPAALTALRRAGLAGRTRNVFSDEPANRVVGQMPAPSARLLRGAAVVLEVSKGRKPVAVPDVTGQHVAAALDTLRAQGLPANVVRVPSQATAGQVLAQHPKGGANAPAGSAVRLNVAAPASPGGTTTTAAAPPPPPRPAVTTVTVPDVRGQKVGDARKELRAAGLVLEIRKVPSPLPKNSVVAQSPRAETARKRGDHVLVTVSRGPAKHAKGAAAGATAATASLPDVTGEDAATATQDLEAAGFYVQAVDQETTDESEDGLVVGQDPSADSQAAAGSKVTIYVGRFGG
jgi:serine/threonine-protein kinase